MHDEICGCYGSDIQGPRISGPIESGAWCPRNAIASIWHRGNKRHLIDPSTYAKDVRHIERRSKRAIWCAICAIKRCKGSRSMAASPNAGLARRPSEVHHQDIERWSVDECQRGYGVTGINLDIRGSFVDGANPGVVPNGVVST